MTREEMRLWMLEWCTRHECILQLNGEVGFGRECVGIMVGDHYVDYDDPSLCSYDLVPNSYHKHDCIAVLGTGAECEEELYEWLKFLDERHARIEILAREEDLGFIGLLMHGSTRARVVI